MSLSLVIPVHNEGSQISYTLNKLDKALLSANNMMHRRQLSLSKEDEAILQHIANERY